MSSLRFQPLAPALAANILADQRSAIPLTCESADEHLGYMRGIVQSAARGIKGAFIEPATGALLLPPHKEAGRAKAAAQKMIDMCKNAQDWSKGRAQLERRWIKGNFALPQEATIKAWIA